MALFYLGDYKTSSKFGSYVNLCFGVQKVVKQIDAKVIMLNFEQATGRDFNDCVFYDGESQASANQ